MKRIALALTWDGVRCTVRALPPRARAFLAGQAKVPSARLLRKLFAQDQVKELRICWVPRLKGGNDVLSEPFRTATGKRLAFRCVRTRRFGDILGVVYQKR